MNICIFTGRIANNPELRYTSTNKSVCKLNLAVEDGFGENKVTIYPTLIAWGKTAENIVKYAPKGTLIEVDSRLSLKSYSDSTGAKHYVTEFNVNQFKILSSVKREEREEGASTIQEESPFTSSMDFNVSDKDLPF